MIEKRLREIVDYDKSRLYYVGTGGRVMSKPGGRGGKGREEDMAPVVRKPKHMYFVRNGVLYERPMGRK